MKRPLSAFCFLLLLFTGCKWDSAPVVTTYTDIAPDACMNCQPTGNVFPTLPRTDSSASHALDLDGDRVNDVEITVRQYKQQFSPMSSGIFYEATLVPLSSQVEFEGNGTFASMYDAGAVIDNSNKWMAGTRMFIQTNSGGGTGLTQNYSGDKFAIYRMRGTGGHYSYGWICIGHPSASGICVRGYTNSSDLPITVARQR